MYVFIPRDLKNAYEGNDAIKVTNYGVNTFAASETGEVTARNSVTVGDIGGGGSNKPGLIKGVGNATLGGKAEDIGIERLHQVLFWGVIIKASARALALVILTIRLRLKIM